MKTEMMRAYILYAVLQWIRNSAGQIAVQHDDDGGASSGVQVSLAHNRLRLI